jgi:hypothetical protein
MKIESQQANSRRPEGLVYSPTAAGAAHSPDQGEEAVNGQGSALPRSLLLLLTLLVLLFAACGGGSATPAQESATVTGNVPVELLPRPEGEVLVQVFPATAEEAEPVATVVTSTGWFTFDVSPGTYFVRVSYYDTMCQSKQLEVAAGEVAEVRFARP